MKNQIYFDKIGIESAALKTVFYEAGEAVAELAGEIESQERYLVVSTPQLGVIMVLGLPR